MARSDRPTAVVARHFQMLSRSGFHGSHASKTCHQHRLASSSAERKPSSKAAATSRVLGQSRLMQPQSLTKPSARSAPQPSPLVMPTTTASSDTVDVPILTLANSEFRKPAPLYPEVQHSSTSYRHIYYRFSADPSWHRTSDSYLAKLVSDIFYEPVEDDTRKLETASKATRAGTKPPASNTRAGIPLSHRSPPSSSTSPKSNLQKWRRKVLDSRTVKTTSRYMGQIKTIYRRAIASMRESPAEYLAYFAITTFILWITARSKADHEAARMRRKQMAEEQLGLKPNGSLRADVGEKSKDERPQPLGSATPTQVESLHDVLDSTQSAAVGTGVVSATSVPANELSLAKQQDLLSQTSLARKEQEEGQNQNVRSWSQVLRFW